KMCDNCRNPKEKTEGKDEILKLLKSVDELKEMQKADYLCAYLNGEKTTEIISYKHDKLPGFAVGKDRDKVYWNAAIRQALVGGLLSKDIESYGVIKLTEKGREFIKNPSSFTLIKEHVFTDSDDDDFSVGGIRDAFDDILYQALLDLRKQISREKKLPPFVIFQEDSLKEMSFQYPITKEELSTISGVGTGKAKRYGAPFLALIKDYVEENEIERPQDLVVRSLVNKSGLKVQLIQNIDRKLPLEDIGEAQGKSLEEIIEEIEVIVNSGTRVNINYYIDDILDDDNQEEIYEYFYEAETDSIEDAYNEFDGDYTEEELRLMRIKFMSEVAN
ncbi:MAG TPA: RQC domain-containing protein, partial [Brumimicrobium sp.]|nr:RQC domain-containing protein [Brumimicrobium sp.]